MALINLQTNLKSLKFGKDRPGGGDSGQPYKTRPIDGKQSTTGGLDVLLRGGSLALTRSVRDASRLTKFFFDFKNPNGILFTAKQNVLSRQNVQTEVSGKLAKRLGISRTGYAGGNLNQGVYLPTSTILQAAGGVAGLHLNLFGIDPSDPMLKRGKNVSGLIPGLGLTTYGDFQAFLQRQGQQTGTKDVVKTKKVRNPFWSMRKKFPELWEETNGFEDQGGGPTRRLEVEYTETLPSEYTNRLVEFYDTKQTNRGGDSGIFGGIFSDGPDVLYKYPGGPGSVLGIGKTTIRFASDNTGGILRTGVNNAYSVTNPDWFLGTADRPNVALSLKGTKYLGATNLYWADLQTNTDNQRTWTANEAATYGSFIETDENILENVYSLNNNSFGKNSNLTNKFFYKPLLGLPDKDILVGPNNFSSFGMKPYVNDSKQDFGVCNYRAVSPQEGEYGFADGASSAYGRAYLKSGAPNATIDIAGINYAENTLPTLRIRTTTGGWNPWLPATDRGGSFLEHNPFVNTGLTFNQKQLMNESSSLYNPTINESFVNKMYLGDDSAAAISTGQNIASFAPDYTKMRRENRLSYGDPGKVSKNRFDYGLEGQFDGTDETYLKEALDKITAAEIYQKDNATHPRSNLFTEAEGGGSGYGRNDLAKFSLGIMQNNSTGKSWWMHFRAFIDSFSDTYTADWSDIKYAGRSEKFYNYDGFGREISLAWTVIAQSKAELIPMYRKLNYLASSLAGDYSSGGFMRGNLVKLNIGGYLYNQVGVITGLTYDVPQEATWEIALKNDGTYDRSVKELPHMIKVTGVKFKPIHDFIPRRRGNPDSQAKTPFIALSNGVNNNYLNNSHNSKGFKG